VNCADRLESSAGKRLGIRRQQAAARALWQAYIS